MCLDCSQRFYNNSLIATERHTAWFPAGSIQLYKALTKLNRNTAHAKYALVKKKKKKAN